MTRRRVPSFIAGLADDKTEGALGLPAKQPAAVTIVDDGSDEDRDIVESAKGKRARVSKVSLEQPTPSPAPSTRAVKRNEGQGTRRAHSSQNSENDDDDDDDEEDDDDDKNTSPKVKRQPRHIAATSRATLASGSGDSASGNNATASSSNGRMASPQASSPSSSSTARKAQTSTSAKAVAPSWEDDADGVHGTSVVYKGGLSAAASFEASDFQPLHLLRAHGQRNNEFDTNVPVFACAFEPSLDGTGTTDNVATAGGEVVCIINCMTGRVLKKYTHPEEAFLALAWTTVTVTTPDKDVRMNLLAAAGSQLDIKIIDPAQLLCYQTIKGHLGPIQCLEFHPTKPTLLLSGSSDKRIIVWDIGIPSGVEYSSKACPIAYCYPNSPINTISFSPSGKIFLAGCENGVVAHFEFPPTLKSGKTKPTTVSGETKLRGPSFHMQSVDSIAFVQGNLVASKGALTLRILLWDVNKALQSYKEGRLSIALPDGEAPKYPCKAPAKVGGFYPVQDDPHVVGLLPYSRTTENRMKFAVSRDGNCLVAGNEVGEVTLYSISDQSAPSTLFCPNPQFKSPVRHVAIDADCKYIVATSHSNLICIWARGVSESQVQTQ